MRRRLRGKTTGAARRIAAAIAAAAAALIVSCFPDFVEDSFAIRKKYQHAVELMTAGSYAAALERLEEVWIESLSGDGVGREKIARLAALRAGEILSERLGKPKDALAWYGRVMEMFPRSEEAVAAMEARASIFSGRLRDAAGAIAELHKLIGAARSQGKRDEYRMKIANLHFRLNDFKQAIIEASPLTGKYARGRRAEEAYLLVGKCHFMLEDYRAAINVFKELVTRFPEGQCSAETRFELGNCFERLGDYDRARRFFEESLREYPNVEVVKIKLRKLEERLAAKREAGAADTRILQATEE